MVGLINEAAIDPSRAPPGKALLKAIVHFVPYAVDGNAKNWDALKEDYADTILAWLDEGVPPRPSQARDRTEGAVAARPRARACRPRSTAPTCTAPSCPIRSAPFARVPEMSNYRTPIDGVYLCGAGAHPGSGVTMGPGRNAAIAICKDRGIAFPGRFSGRADGKGAATPDPDRGQRYRDGGTPPSQVVIPRRS